MPTVRAVIVWLWNTTSLALHFVDVILIFAVINVSRGSPLILLYVLVALRSHWGPSGRHPGGPKAPFVFLDAGGVIFVFAVIMWAGDAVVVRCLQT